VFDHIVQQSRRDAAYIQPHFGQNIGDFEGMSQIRLAGFTHLPLMNHCRKEVGPAQNIQIVAPVVALDLLQYVFKSYHRSDYKPQRARNAAATLPSPSLRALRSYISKLSTGLLSLSLPVKFLELFDIFVGLFKKLSLHFGIGFEFGLLAIKQSAIAVG